MSDQFDEIPAHIQRTTQILAELIRRLDSFDADIVPKIGRTSQSVLIPVQILDTAYTAIETLFLRISQAFENNLASERWHADLLEKMTLDIARTRPRVISDESHGRLKELMRFRHFNRYYFEMDYDWRKIDLLVAILREAVPLLTRDLDGFSRDLRSILAE